MPSIIVVRSASLCLGLAALLAAAPAAEEENLARLQDPALKLAEPESRARLVAALQKDRDARREETRATAAALGLPMEITGRNGKKRLLTGFRANGRPRYLVTHNANAAISTGANVLQSPPLSLTGSGFTLGIWDGGPVRFTHVEMASRVILKETGTFDDHATHVAGTMIASGVNPQAKGMCPAATLDSYYWDNDLAEMTARGASYPQEPGKLAISNQSYGYVAGWDYVGLSSHDWEWNGQQGSSASSTDASFGMYDEYAAEDDSLAVAAPYFLMFRSAGNDREDNPETGDSVELPNRSSYVAYNPATMPAGDGVFKGGYETMISDSLAKNLISVGSVGDAVNNGQRDISKAYMSDYSCWGPTDDGRIKPDLVANGEELTSSVATNNTAYDVYSGTSMASPNAAGSAMQLVQLYDQLRPGQMMRASTLKALLIHTADDLGTPGPDYEYGWGLENVIAGAGLLQDEAANPTKQRITEDLVSSQITSRTLSFTWDGVSPIRATLCWTDPAGPVQSTADSRTPVLVNDLNLKIVGPDGVVHRPWVMPYVGTWTKANLSAAATTGINHTDNVEQVLIATPSVAGTYQAVVDFTGALSGGAQTYSLILSGSTAGTLPAPMATSVSPASFTGGTGLTAFTVTGSHFQTGATVGLTRAGAAPVMVGHMQFTSETLSGRADLSLLPAGTYTVTVTNPDGGTVALPTAVTVGYGTLWSENFENGAGAWTTTTTSGTQLWTLASSGGHGNGHCFTARPLAAIDLSNLVSPVITIPAGTTNLALSFWHSYRFMAPDAGALEVSADGGTTWNDVTKSGIGGTFTQNGYEATVASGSTNPLSGHSAWTTTSSGYVQSILTLDSTIYAGKKVAFRWRIGADATTPSLGWSVDDIALTGKVPTTTFAQWQTAEFASTTSPASLATADPDGDGLSNLAEFALGTDPKTSNANPLSYVVNGDGSLTLSFTRPTTISGVVYHAEVSADLATWTEVTLVSDGIAGTVEALHAKTPAGQTPAFIRLRFEQTP